MEGRGVIKAPDSAASLVCRPEQRCPCVFMLLRCMQARYPVRGYGRAGTA